VQHRRSGLEPSVEAAVGVDGGVGGIQLGAAGVVAGGSRGFKVGAGEAAGADVEIDEQVAGFGAGGAFVGEGVEVAGDAHDAVGGVAAVALDEDGAEGGHDGGDVFVAFTFAFAGFSFAFAAAFSLTVEVEVEVEVGIGDAAGGVRESNDRKQSDSSDPSAAPHVQVPARARLSARVGMTSPQETQVRFSTLAS